MASDGLNQVGKYIKETRKNADYALSRPYSKIPAIERTRDIFDPANEFKMDFRTNTERQTIRMDLFLNKPPPGRSCTGHCKQSRCESFTTSSGDVILGVSEIFETGSVQVFVNGVAWTNFHEYSRSAKQVYVGGLPSQLSNTVVICYLYFTCEASGIDVYHSRYYDLVGTGTDYFAQYGGPPGTYNLTASRQAALDQGSLLTNIIDPVWNQFMGVTSNGIGTVRILLNSDCALVPAQSVTITWKLLVNGSAIATYDAVLPGGLYYAQPGCSFDTYVSLVPGDVVTATISFSSAQGANIPGGTGQQTNWQFYGNLQECICED